jgi:hypothetical protein
MATGGGRVVPAKGEVKSPKKGTKVGKKGQKRWPHHLAIVASDGSGRAEADDSGEGFVVTAECDFKLWARPLKDHFKKLLEVACPHHPYPIKHKLNDFTMIKRFTTSGAPPAVIGWGWTREEGVWHPFLWKWKSWRSSADPSLDLGNATWLIKELEIFSWNIIYIKSYSPLVKELQFF